MKILAHSHVSHTVTDAPPPLKELVKGATGSHVRRIGRFIQLALIGAGRCVQAHDLAKDTSVYLSSGRGDLEVTLEVLADMVERGLPPKPLSFINTVSNSSCFYVAKTFGLHGSSQFVTRRHAPLESALQLAMLDLTHNNTRTALVGTVDIVTLPLTDHRERLALAADTPIGEGSHWLLLAGDAHAGDALAHIDTVLTFPDSTALASWWRNNSGDLTQAALAAGQHLGESGIARIQSITGINTTLDYRSNLPWYDSQAGSAIEAFINQSDITQLFYVDTDPQGRFSVIRCQK